MLIAERESTMRTSYPLRGSLTALIAASMIAGCSGNAAPMAPTTVGQNQDPRSMQQRGSLFNENNEMRGRRSDLVSSHAVTTPSFFDPDAKGKPLIFVSDESGNVVDIYLQRGKNKMVGQITGLNFPQGIATDSAGNVYVANDNTTEVPVYAPPYTGAPKLILDDTGYFPQGVAVSRQGIAAVANICNAPSCSTGSGSVTFYRKNSTTSCTTVTTPTTFLYTENATFDDNGNLYVIGLGNSGTLVGEVKQGCDAKKFVSLTTGNAMAYGYGIQVTKSDQIAILDPHTNAIYTYDPPHNGSLGEPVTTTPLTTTGSFPTDFAFLASGTNLYTAELPGSNGYAKEYAYPAGGTPEKTITVGNGGPVGVAVTPPLVP